MEKKKLYRSRTGTIGGVCTGLANYFEIEPLLVQIVFLTSIWSPLPAIFTYFMLWILMKKEPKV
jgi:phage shock protein PspC (stress-responsive transcriptional regulator)